ncbi:PhzF family phenazine biosynthesis protein [Novosphingobium cyanobacteriorum]|uniref:PhzF family phenazine biosynthesis protein n=1 Tax=Novosphingobium cyanobacteriorum TaxID=3024215 RepID=A0ABT6CLG9_9SPHN|nr:PhzF family phenazine biosynthesis protein [Novosphingobium cyanobacteriorum]MDF8334764.1 PhzF family phenazine biosynthesis protein [Novosphingobium cyanobacteriorum]
MLLDLVDVFASRPLTGNPLAVVRGGEGLSTEAMLALTRWLGFSETTFLLPPTDPAADYRVRIFYQAGELPFAGHPTLGSARAWLAAGGEPRQPGMIVQECGIGLVTVRDTAGDLAFRAPPLIRSGPLSPQERAQAIRIAGVDEDAVLAAVHACNGPGWKLLHLRSAIDVLAAKPAPAASVPTDIGLVGAHEPGGDAAFEVRAFFTNPQGKLVEDPVTGSLNASVALYLFEGGHAACDYIAAQGRLTGADGRVAVSREDDGVWIGGKAVMISEGGLLTMQFWFIHFPT